MRISIQHSALILVTLFLVIMSGCVKGPDYPDEPIITFLSIDKDTISQSALGKDTLIVSFQFTDGDGNLGRNGQLADIFLIDSRLGVVQDSFKIPTIPEKGTKNGIDGQAQVLFKSTCCIFPDGTPPCKTSSAHPLDSFQLGIYIKDRKDNTSNTITTPYIYLRCD